MVMMEQQINLKNLLILKSIEMSNLKLKYQKKSIEPKGKT